MRIWTFALCLGFVATALLGSGPPAAGQLWKNFMPSERVEADPQADYQLAEENGPWMIIAATFSGDGAADQARELVLEFRHRYNLPAYVYDRAFDFHEEQLGRGMDKYGAPIRRRYRRGDRVREIAVLVGDFPAIDDPEAQNLLKRIKTLEPQSLSNKPGEQTTQTMAQVRELQDAFLAKLGTKRSRGPMCQAFLARNPLLPREYFVPKGVDQFVAKMNRGVKHSLLDCPGKYTVKVATFGGRSVIQASTASSSPFAGFSKDRENDPLVEAAENAHLLTVELRKHNWDAYEFHDRTESIVTIGSFDEVARQLPDGRTVPTPEVQHIIRTFGAAYNTPSDPLLGSPSDARNQMRTQEVKQQFNQVFSAQRGEIAQGLHPKHVKILKGRRVERVIPIDVHPHTMEVPHRSVSSSFLGW